MDKKTLLILLGIAIVAFVAVRLLFAPGGNEVVIEMTPDEQQMHQQMQQMMNSQMQGQVPMPPQNQ